MNKSSYAWCWGYRCFVAAVGITCASTMCQSLCHTVIVFFFFFFLFTRKGRVTSIFLLQMKRLWLRSIISLSQTANKWQGQDCKPVWLRVTVTAVTTMITVNIHRWRPVWQVHRVRALVHYVILTSPQPCLGGLIHRFQVRKHCLVTVWPAQGNTPSEWKDSNSDLPVLKTLLFLLQHAIHPKLEYE